VGPRTTQEVRAMITDGGDAARVTVEMQDLQDGCEAPCP